MTCPYYDCGWCYAKNGTPNNSIGGECIRPSLCEQNNKIKTVDSHDKENEYLSGRIIALFKELEQVKKVANDLELELRQIQKGKKDAPKQ